MKLSAAGDSEMLLAGTLRLAELRFSRRIAMAAGSSVVRISETIENLAASDRPIAWTQHVTLGSAVSRSGADAVPHARDSLKSGRRQL